MYEIVVINLDTHQKFTKRFDSPYLLEKFKNKCKYSKKVKIISESIY